VAKVTFGERALEDPVKRRKLFTLNMKRNTKTGLY
jgi:hypothetical protein